MKESRIRRFELDPEEARRMIDDYLSDIQGVSVDVIKLKSACETSGGGLIIALEVEG